MNIKNTIVICLLSATAIYAEAQTSSTQVQNLLTVPSGVTLPAFNPNGLSFTNAAFKAAIGSEFNSGGGVLSYLQGDADIWNLGSVDVGFSANATLSGTGTGLHSTGGFVALFKNFNNFQLATKAGGGMLFENPSCGYAAQIFEVNYNLSEITSGFFSGSHLLSYVGANLETDEGHFATGGNFQKQFHLFLGWGF